MERLHTSQSGRGRRLWLGMTVAAALAVTLAACSASNGTKTSGTPGTSGTKHTSAATAPAASSSPASQPAAAASGLSGTWHGQYGGSYQGTFVLRWHQSGSKLSGHIRISSPAANLPIHGSVAGGSIRFGTVGSYAITYSGTVSGGSMSGSYHVANGSGGNWSAAKA